MARGRRRGNWWAWGGGENEWVPLMRETDEVVQPSTYKWVTGTSWHQMSFAMTPSSDGQSLTRCILVISVSGTTLKNRLYSWKLMGEQKKKEKKEGRKEGKRKHWQSVRRQFEKSGTCAGRQGVGRRWGEKLGWEGGGGGAGGVERKGPVALRGKGRERIQRVDRTVRWVP